MKVCIAEKPSVAREIAVIVGAKDRREGYFEGNGYQVTWTFGHFCTLKEPHEYTSSWRRWSLDSLPMIPPRFSIKLIENEDAQRQFSVIEKLIAKASVVINCGDAGQEGELIQRWVLQKAKCEVPVKRLWISSLTEESIREGFSKLREAKDFDRLYEAGLSRAIGDWLLGMNATRLYTVKYGRDRSVLSIGRVQTPTLALVVARHLEIERFVSEPFWELKTTYRDTIFTSTKGRFTEKEKGIEFLKKIDNSLFEVTDISIKKGKEYAPRLFDLTALQVECNKKFAFSADETLKVIQSLYEKKLTTYPRVDTTYLSDDMFPKIPAILRGLEGYEELLKPLEGKVKKDKRVFDNSKVTDHHAIIPTGVRANNITDYERKVYDLIVRRFIAVFYPFCQISTTTVLGEVNEIEFKTIGKQILNPGWRVVFDKSFLEDDEEENVDKDEDRILPDFQKAESGEHEPDLLERWTSPPRYHTEATLLRAMETAGKLVNDEELRDVLKENGIGRPSTRAAIIETLFKRDYIHKERKNLLATQMGIDLIATIKDDLLKSAELTGIWENKLRQIERGEYEAKLFIEELKELLVQIVANVKTDKTSTLGISELVVEPEPIRLTCPLCKKGSILKGKEAYGCSEYKNGCQYLYPFGDIAEGLSDKELIKLLTEAK